MSRELKQTSAKTKCSWFHCVGSTEQTYDMAFKTFIKKKKLHFKTT